MDLTQQEQQPFSKKEQKFKSRVEKILASQDLTLQRQLVERISQQLGIEAIDCAAALVLLSQTNLYQPLKEPLAKKQSDHPKVIINPAPVSLHSAPLLKMVRYRIDVGQKHNTSLDEIKNVFIEEAGVDRKMIGDVDIRYHYTLIELPEGMPADIYQLLTTVNIQQQKLNIKRLKHRDRHLSHPQRKNKV
jgi:ATP-dependent RNA helicase DeaD